MTLFTARLVVPALAAAVALGGTALAQSPRGSADAQTQTYDAQSYGAYAQAKAAKKGKQRAARQKVRPQRHAGPKPCAAYYWGGCLGWDPDPHVRMMIQHDRNIFDD